MAMTPIAGDLHPRTKHWHWKRRKATDDEGSERCKKREFNKADTVRDIETEVSSTSSVSRGASPPFWPLDFLPRDCPNSRILTWGYDSVVSNFFKGSANKNTILQHSCDLLDDGNAYVIVHLFFG
jgi:ankyrin repeat domain-containing protein 50